MLRPLALTLGEPAGIGPDCARAAFAQRVALYWPPF
jgi:4-hydroxy-L-threonine phosphate dehydrogenase PdxA